VKVELENPKTQNPKPETQNFLHIPANPSGEPEYTRKADLSERMPVELSCKSEYALLALVELAAHFNTGEPLQIRQIAAEQNIPDRYLEQLLATLRRCGLVRSQRGAKVVQGIEGADASVAEPSRDPRSVEGAVVWDVWHEAGRAAEAVLQKYTLQDIADKRDARRQLDLMYYI
jgi:DNA-binding IscR family transcriptional regulator